MNIRSLLAAGSLVASMAFPAIAGAQVQFRAGIHVGGPAPVVVAQPQPVYVQPAPQPVFVQQQPVYVQPAGPMFVGRPGYGHHRRQVIIEAPRGGYGERRHHGGWRR